MDLFACLQAVLQLCDRHSVQTCRYSVLGVRGHHVHRGYPLYQEWQGIVRTYTSYQHYRVAAHTDVRIGTVRLRLCIMEQVHSGKYLQITNSNNQLKFSCINNHSNLSNFSTYFIVT